MLSTSSKTPRTLWTVASAESTSAACASMNRDILSTCGAAAATCPRDTAMLAIERLATSPARRRGACTSSLSCRGQDLARRYCQRTLLDHQNFVYTPWEPTVTSNTPSPTLPLRTPRKFERKCNMSASPSSKKDAHGSTNLLHSPMTSHAADEAVDLRAERRAPPCAGSPPAARGVESVSAGESRTIVAKRMVGVVEAAAADGPRRRSRRSYREAILRRIECEC
eukprot:SAG31_NODE_4808_length_2945_cov_2.155306_6_plen_224_part_00